MKFATLALLGVVSAQDMLDTEVEEMIKVVYPWAAVKDYAKQAKEIDATAHEIGEAMQPRINHLKRKIDVIGQRLDVIGDFLEPRADRVGDALVTPGMKIENKLHDFIHGKFAQAAEKKAEAEWKQMEPQFDQHAENMRKRYVPELQAWGKSKAVQAKKANEEAWMNSKELKQLLKSVKEIQDDAEESTKKMRWGAAGTEEGWTEWANNDAVGEMIEDVVQILRDFKALMTNKESRADHELGMAVFQDEHFKNIVGMATHDEDMKAMGGMLMKLGRHFRTLKQWQDQHEERMGKKFMENAGNFEMPDFSGLPAMGKMPAMPATPDMPPCPLPKVKQLIGQVLRLMKTIHKTRKVMDVPTEAGVKKFLSGL